MVAKTRSHGSIEEEGIEMENRSEIIKIQEKLRELDTLRFDVVEIKSLLYARFSQASRSGAEVVATETR